MTRTGLNRQMNVRKWLAVLCCLGLVGQYPGAAMAAKKVQYGARYKAKYPAVQNAGDIGILDFKGPDGSNFQSALTSELASVEIDGRPVFTVKAVEGIRLANTGDMTKAEIAAAQRLGRTASVRTVFTGTITSAAITANNYNRQNQVCAQPKGLLKCARYETRNVACSTVSGHYAVSPRAIDVVSGTILYAEAVSIQSDYTICDGQLQGSGVNLLGIFGGGQKAQGNARAVSTPEALLEKIRFGAASAIRVLVAPTTRALELVLKDSAPGLSKPDATAFSNAVEFAGVGRMDRACGAFETLHIGAANQQNVALLYNLGVCQEVLLPEDPSAALEYYARADQLLSRPDKLVSDALLRMRAMVGQARGIAKPR